MTIAQEGSAERWPLRIREHFHPFQVCFRLIELMMHLCWHTMRFGTRLLVKRLTRYQRSWQALLGQSLAEFCEASGATFIKMGQILSTRGDLLPQEMMAPLARLQDCIKPFSFRHVPAIVMGRTDRSLQEIFAEFEECPISSASIASVYRARLHTGQRVAVKVRRPDVVRKVRDDLRLMRLFTRCLALLPVLQLVPVVEMVHELGHWIEEQLDLRIEARNTRHFRALFAQDRQIHIPALVEEHCGEAVLVMEYFDDLIRIDELDWPEAEYQEALMIGLGALYRMIFLDGWIHCDLHPGNLYFRRGGEVVILDAGFVARLEQADRYQFVEFFLGIATNSGRNCARIIYETALKKPSTFDKEGFERAIVELINRSAGSKAEAFQVAAFAFQIFDIQRRFGLRSSTSFTMAIISLLVFEGIAKRLYPRLDFQAAARPVLLQSILRRRSEMAVSVVSDSRS